MPTISAIIITKNEAHNIKECIKSVLWTDEIIILDSKSTDHTLDICKQYTPKVKIYEADWPGFGKQKNRALNHATSEWILSIDADERITPKLKEEILCALDKNPINTSYQIKRKTYFLNRPINFCYGNSDAPLRLAKKKECKFSEDIVHERMITYGKIIPLKNMLQHFSSKDIEELLNKTNKYSSLGAIKLEQNHGKTNYIKAISSSFWIFTKMYFLRLGFLDGWAGFIIALSSFEGTFYKYAKLMERKDQIK